MTPRSPEILSWLPSATAEAATLPCGGEHIREPVLPSTPIMSARIHPSSSQYPPKVTVDVSVVKDLLNEQGAVVMERMEVLMSKQERLITCFLQACLKDDDMLQASCVPNAVGMPSASHVSNKTVAFSSVVNTWDDEEPETPSRQVPETCDEDLVAGSPKIRGSASFRGKFGGQNDAKNMLDQSAAELFIKTMMHGKESFVPEADLPAHRKYFQQMLNSPLYDLGMTAVIVFNTLLIVVETDSNATCVSEADGCAPAWLSTMNLILLVLYTVESFIVIEAHRWKTFQQKSRVFEILIVVFGYVDFLVHEVLGDTFPNVGALKLIRLTRILRGVRLFQFFPELNFIIVGFAGAMKAMLWGYLMLVLILIAMGIVSVELLNSDNKSLPHESEYCSELFDSVWNATLWLFQTVLAGDSWGYCSIPIIQNFKVTVIFFAGVLVTLQVGFLNLIMSVIIDRVADARSNDTQAKLAQKEKEIGTTLKKWFDLFDKLDRNKDGELTEEELMKGFETLPDFSDDLKLLGIEKFDIPNLIALIDTDKNNHVSLDELLSLLDMVVHFDGKMHQVMMGLELRVIGQSLEDRMKKLERQVVTGLLSRYSC